ncbi:hypothetical protein QZH41_007105 [Actinostola sp. cb2023]|nr:hypothetical protein QZH41_007105 [Actinostola sp. cb2023]
MDTGKGQTKNKTKKVQGIKNDAKSKKKKKEKPLDTVDNKSSSTVNYLVPLETNCKAQGIVSPVETDSLPFSVNQLLEFHKTSAQAAVKVFEEQNIALDVQGNSAVKQDQIEARKIKKEGKRKPSIKRKKDVKEASQSEEEFPSKKASKIVGQTRAIQKLFAEPHQERSPDNKTSISSGHDLVNRFLGLEGKSKFFPDLCVEAPTEIILRQEESQPETFSMNNKEVEKKENESTASECSTTREEHKVLDWRMSRANRSSRLSSESSAPKTGVSECSNVAVNFVADQTVRSLTTVNRVMEPVAVSSLLGIEYKVRQIKRQESGEDTSSTVIEQRRRRKKSRKVLENESLQEDETKNIKEKEPKKNKKTKMVDKDGDEMKTTEQILKEDEPVTEKPNNIKEKEPKKNKKTKMVDKDGDEMKTTEQILKEDEPVTEKPNNIKEKEPKKNKKTKMVDKDGDEMKTTEQMVTGQLQAENDTKKLQGIKNDAKSKKKKKEKLLDTESKELMDTEKRDDNERSTENVLKSSELKDTEISGEHGKKSKKKHAGEKDSKEKKSRTKPKNKEKDGEQKGQEKKTKTKKIKDDISSVEKTSEPVVEPERMDSSIQESAVDEENGVLYDNLAKKMMTDDVLTNVTADKEVTEEKPLKEITIDKLAAKKKTSTEKPRKRKKKSQESGSEVKEKKKRKVKQPSEEFFVQNGVCSMFPKLPRCRDCRDKEDTMPPSPTHDCCRFTLFRRLKKKRRSGKVHVAGFMVPENAEKEDLDPWIAHEDVINILSKESALYILSNVADEFCSLVQEEKGAKTSRGDGAVISYKRAVIGLREMCDACATTIFNIHWVCQKCGFGVCLDCYDLRVKEKTNTQYDDDDDDDDDGGGDDDDVGGKKVFEFKWFHCIPGVSHQPKNLIISQIIPKEEPTVPENNTLGVVNLSSGLTLLMNYDSSSEDSPEISPRKCAAETDPSSNAFDFNLGLLALVASKRTEVTNTESLDSQNSETNGEDQLDTPKHSHLDAQSDWFKKEELEQQSIQTEDQMSCSTNEVETSTIGEVTCSEVTMDTSSIRDQPQPDMLITNDEYPAPHSFMCNGRLLRLHEPHHPGNREAFAKRWIEGKPILVSNIDKLLDDNLWSPESFEKEFGEEITDVVNCRTGKTVENFSVGAFWKGFECVKDRAVDSCGEPMLLKLKDWPPGDDFSEKLPSRFKNLMDHIPLPDYTRRDGLRNLVARLPTFFVKPDLGPKMYNAYGSAAHPTEGTTNLHIDMSDAVNIMVYVGVPRDEGAGERERTAAIKAVDIACDEIQQQRVRRETARIVAREWNLKYPTHHDPIHDQVRNLYSCVKIAEDFVSPEVYYFQRIGHCFKTTQEFRHLSDKHTNHEDKLQYSFERPDRQRYAISRPQKVPYIPTAKGTLYPDCKRYPISRPQKVPYIPTAKGTLYPDCKRDPISQPQKGPYIPTAKGTLYPDRKRYAIPRPQKVPYIPTAKGTLYPDRKRYPISRPQKEPYIPTAIGTLYPDRKRYAMSRPQKVRYIPTAKGTLYPDRNRYPISRPQKVPYIPTANGTLCPDRKRYPISRPQKVRYIPTAKGTLYPDRKRYAISRPQKVPN